MFLQRVHSYSEPFFLLQADSSLIVLMHCARVLTFYYPLL